MQISSLDTQLLEELPEPLALVSNGHGRSIRFMLQVIGEHSDLLLARSEQIGSLLQAPKELEPSGGKWVEVALIGSLAFDFIGSHDSSRSIDQSKHLRNREEITGVLSQVSPGIALAGAMHQKGKAFLQQRSRAISRQCKRTLEKLIEHIRTDVEQDEKTHFTSSITPYLCGAGSQPSAKISPNEPTKPHN